MKFIKKIFKREEGATAIEYGLIEALVAVAAMVGMNALGTSLDLQFSTLANRLTLR
jgi:pilus assembly protein Flp/PilA